MDDGKQSGHNTGGLKFDKVFMQMWWYLRPRRSGTREWSVHPGLLVLDRMT